MFLRTCEDKQPRAVFAVYEREMSLPSLALSSSSTARSPKAGSKVPLSTGFPTCLRPCQVLQALSPAHALPAWLFLYLSGLFAWTGPSCLNHQQLHLLPRAFCQSNLNSQGCRWSSLIQRLGPAQLSRLICPDTRAVRPGL